MLHRSERPRRAGFARRVAIISPLSLAAALATLAFAAGCSDSSLSWQEIDYPAAPELMADSVTMLSVPADACPGSAVASRAGAALYAAWWRVRPDSSALLMAARSTDGGRTWSDVTPADTTDVSRRGCRRPPPAIVADSATNYVDYAYFLEANEGPGIFYTHSMDAAHLGTGNGVFHSPVAVLYGAKPSHVALAARGNDVAVVYEDPNSERPMIGLALSHTMGHIFETRAQVSDLDLPAVAPLVALHRDTVIVQWIERPDTVSTGGRIALRRAVWR